MYHGKCILGRDQTTFHITQRHKSILFVQKYYLKLLTKASWRSRFPLTILITFNSVRSMQHMSAYSARESHNGIQSIWA